MIASLGEHLRVPLPGAQAVHRARELPGSSGPRRAQGDQRELLGHPPPGDPS